MNLSGLGSGQQERAAYKPPAWIDSAPEMRRLGPAYAKQESQVDAKLMESIQKQQGIGAKPLLPQEPPGAQTTGYGAVPKQASADLTGM
jgi:hypothetical protein